jgi:hypothetical protein
MIAMTSFMVLLLFREDDGARARPKFFTLRAVPETATTFAFEIRFETHVEVRFRGSISRSVPRHGRGGMAPLRRQARGKAPFFA